MDISKSSFIYYQDKDFYYFWKPAGLSSSRGKSVSFLDLLLDEKNKDEIGNIVESQKNFFGREMELGLLNRLDNATSGLLYFAKNLRVYRKFRILQVEGNIDKYYLAVVYGNIQKWVSENGNIIKFPIMHHKFSDDRMVIILKDKDKNKGKGKLHEVETEILEMEYNKEENVSIVMLKIHKGIRHQIRIHLSSIGYPICGDELYCRSKKKSFDKLQLFSIGMTVCEL